MPWNNQNENGAQKPQKNPWGQTPSGGMRPNDFEELLARAKEEFAKLFPGGGLGPRGWMVAGIAVVVMWLLSGVYIVSPSEQGVVLRFGKFIRHTDPGINYHLPWPIETAYTPDVMGQRQIDIGFRKVEDGRDRTRNEDKQDESLMLTGDENIVDVNFSVFWRIKDANAYLFNVDLRIDERDDVVKAVAESTMREVVGQNRIDNIMTSRREEIQQQVLRLMQAALDSYRAGILVTDVKLQKADPPGEVRDAYIDVQKALADQDRKRNEAEAHANTIIPQARGDAAKIVQDAEAYRQRAIAEASGEAKRFLSVYEQYKKAPEVTKRRMYFETMSQVLMPMNKIIVDDAAKGVVPYIQLPALAKTLPPPQPSESDQKAPQTSSSAGGAP